MKIKAYDIDWCVEEEDLMDEISPEDFPNEELYYKEVMKRSAEIKNELPDEVVVEVDDEDEELIANAISDKVGWLMYSYEYKVI